MVEKADRPPIFVFGSNTQGRHGKGAALHAAKNFNAKYGVAKGRTGHAYAICTKELRRGRKAVTLQQIGSQIIFEFLPYVRQHKDETFLLTRVGCGLAGFKDFQIMEFFYPAYCVGNVPNLIIPELWTQAFMLSKQLGATVSEDEVITINGLCPSTEVNA